MEESPLTPQPERREPEHTPETAENHLDKSLLNRNQAEKMMERLRDHQLALAIARLRNHDDPAEEIEDSSPLQLFGLITGSLRRERGLSLDEFSRRTGMPVERLLSIEVGASDLEEVAAALPAIGKALGSRDGELAQALMDLVLPPP